ncbi:MAG: hypothetical protein V1645_00100 [archaeon]
MADFDVDKEEKLKIAFSKIKEDINNLKIEFDTLKEVIGRQQELLESLLSEMAKNRQNSPDYGVFQGLPGTASSGNEGVQTNKQTNNQTNKQTHPKQTNTSFPVLSSITENHEMPPSEPFESPKTSSPSFSSLKKDLLAKFGSLPKREFLIFLTIYQLEEDKGSVSYSDVAIHLKLSESGVRHYTFNLIKKGVPIQKRKINNKTTVLSVSPEFKEYNLKKDLVDLYLHLDSKQKTLMDEY